MGKKPATEITPSPPLESPPGCLPFSQAGFSLDMARENLPFFTLMAATAACYAVPATPAVQTAGIGAVCALQRMLIRGAQNTVKPDLAGKVCVVTGASSGIGAHTTLGLAALGATVIGSTRRDVFEAEEELEAVAKTYATGRQAVDTLMDRVVFKQMELGSLESVADFARFARTNAVTAEAGGIHLLVNNAGCMQPTMGTTKDGLELHTGCNFLGPFALTEALLPAMFDDAPNRGPRVVNVSSGAHVGVRKPKAIAKEYLYQVPTFKKGDPNSFRGWEYYGASKLLNIYHADHLAARRATAVSLHPGGVASNFFRHMSTRLTTTFYYPAVSLLLRTPAEASQTVLNAALRDDVIPGGYYSGCALRPHGRSKLARDAEERQAVIDWAMHKASIDKLWEWQPGRAPVLK